MNEQVVRALTTKEQNHQSDPFQANGSKVFRGIVIASQFRLQN